MVPEGCSIELSEKGKEQIKSVEQARNVEGAGAFGVMNPKM